MLVYKDFNIVGSRDSYEGEFPMLQIEGVKELDTLCPISKLTGFPTSMEASIRMISDKDSRLADALFQIIPTVNGDLSISDDDKLKMLVSRLDSGSLYENDKVSEALLEISKEFFPDADVNKVLEESKIDFSVTDNLSVNE